MKNAEKINVKPSKMKPMKQPIEISNHFIELFSKSTKY